ncbi:4Fe-4S binding domain-containing protein [Vibrio xiamenensis]|uniref:4Fe-4S binding domain-containing protein n=1 Tax=Vibrio xiamenensis TaxID=861298 RepID=A0A1G8D2H5_9VIBR|nr:4Fe-4S binding protein [Vibrio xiamenensis]SDH51882.1 4Fe-4S binding domain-containing protein [Vibrio xiamenensis]
MDMTITDLCTGCHACYSVCPNKAIYKTVDETPLFAIHSKRCNGCEGIHDQKQCASICPIEEAILFKGKPLNPKGSLAPMAALKPFFASLSSKPQVNESQLNK